MRRFPVHIKNIDGTQTACTTFQLWSGLTTNIAEAHICPPYSAITRTDLTNPTGFTADIYYNEPTLIDEIYVFLVHCDGFILPSSGVPCCGDTQPKKQGGYQVRAVKLFCPTPTPTPTASRAVICIFEGGTASIVSGTLPGPTPTATPPAPTPTATGPIPTASSIAPTPTHTTLQNIDFTVTPSCVGYAPTGITITISDPTGGTGTGYYVVMTSPDGQDSTHYSLPHSYTGLNNYVGNTYAFSVFDSEGNGGNKVLVDSYSCASAPNNTAYVGLVVSSIKPTSAQCTSAINYSVELNSPTATFCDATTFTNSNFEGLTTGNNYWLCYDGQTRQMFHPSNAGYFQQAGGCQTI